MDWINDVIKDVSELDYSSPEGQPDVMLVTAEELRAILLERSGLGSPTPEISDERSEFDGLQSWADR